MSIRWSEDELAAFEKRRQEMLEKGHVRTHVLKGEEGPQQQGRLRGRPKGKKVPPMGQSALELEFSRQLLDAKFPPARREFKFMVDRGWRFDYAWPDRMIAVEVQGMVHRIKARFLADVEKLAMAQISGWRVLLVAGQDVRSGRALSWLISLWCGDGNDYQCDHVWEGGRCAKCHARP